MIDVNSVKEQAEKEVREESMAKAKEKIKGLLRKEAQAKEVLLNVQKELADAYATIGQGNSL